MKDKNPNPRMWRSPAGRTIIDLKYVAAVVVDARDYTLVYFRGAGDVHAAGSVSQAGPLRLKVSAETAKSLMDALEIYRSRL